MSATAGCRREVESIEGELLPMVEKGGRRKVVLNLGGVQSVVSNMLAKLIGLDRRARAAGGRLALCQLHPLLYEDFQTLRLTRFFNIYETEPEAVQSFSHPPGEGAP